MRNLKHLALVFWFTAGAAEVPSDDIGGIGVVLGVEGQNIVVKGIRPDSPAAAQKDIHVGDRIIAVAQDQEPDVRVKSGKLPQTLHLLRGPKGTTVRLTIVPFGGDDSRVRIVSFVRAEMKALSDWGDGVLLTDGVKAPDIEMVGFEHQKSERLSDYAGKIIVLEFWATWCGPCQPKMADLQTYSRKYPDWNGKVVLIAASVDDSVDIQAKHLKAKGWGKTHNVWLGTPAKKAYYIDAIPTAYVIDRQGKIVAANPVDIADVVNHQFQRGQATGAK